MTLSYVLITPARNEAALIEQTIQSVVSQTLKPLKWVIVSDGSTDGTDEIVTKYAKEHEWMELVRMPERKERHFGGKALAFNAGFERVKHLKFDIIGNLDADITFESDYLAFLINKFEENPDLGVGGTPYLEDNRSYDYRFASVEHVSGACQLFRRVCYEAIGGYKPIESGGIDLMAVTTARMLGWQTRSFLEKSCHHHRRIGSASRGRLATLLHHGRTDYLQGVHPAWAFARSAYHLNRPPYLVGGLALGWGYFWSMLSREERTAAPEVVAFRRSEQVARLREIVLRPLRFERRRRLAVSGSLSRPARHEAAPAQPSRRHGPYVLITPARDEARYIERTIESVIRQSVLPACWVIANDGSTDGTVEIVRRYASVHPWMKLVSLGPRSERHFGGKARAVNAGLSQVRDLSYEFVGNLDADVSLDADHFEFLLEKFGRDPALGLAGTAFVEHGHRYDYRFASSEHVPGMCQLFRRECFEAIGGYMPIKEGGVDLIAVVTARMKGWKTQAFVEKELVHHRAMGTAKYSGLRLAYKDGYHDFLMGSHPLWQLCRCGYQSTKRPVLLLGTGLLAGYLWAAVRRPKRPVSPEFVRYRRREQMSRLAAFLKQDGRASLPSGSPSATADNTQRC